MSFAAGEVGMERGAVKLLFDHTPTVLDRYADSGPPRAVEITLPGTPVMVEYEEEQHQPYLKIRILYLSAAQLATLLSLVQDTGPLSLKTNPTAAAIDAAVASYEVKHVVGGDYPDDLDSALLAYQADVTFIRL